MELEVIIKFLRPESLVLVPVLYIIGYFLKQTPNIPPWTIPWVQVIVGIIACVFIYELSIHSFVQGVLVAGVAVFTQTMVRRNGNGNGKNGNGKNGNGSSNQNK